MLAESKRKEPGCQRPCQISGACKLAWMLHEALTAFLTVLDKYTLADILVVGEPLLTRLGLEEAVGS